MSRTHAPAIKSAALRVALAGVVFCPFAPGQNLIPDGSFETGSVTYCGEGVLPDTWFYAGVIQPGADVYTPSCSQVLGLDVNAYQHWKNFDAHDGLRFAAGSSVPEPFGTTLLSKLSAGTRYRLSAQFVQSKTHTTTGWYNVYMEPSAQAPWTNVVGTLGTKAKQGEWTFECFEFIANGTETAMILESTNDSVDPAIYVTYLGTDSWLLEAVAGANSSCSPDLVVMDVSDDAVQTDCQSLHAFGTATATVRNVGTGPVTTPFTVTLFEDSDGDGAYTPGIDLVFGEAAIASALNPGSEITVGVAIDDSVAFAGNLIHATADSGLVVIELDETNNTSNTGLACETDPTGGLFSPILEWSWTSSSVLPNHLDVMSVPGVIDLNRDGTPDVVFGATDLKTGGSIIPGVLRALNGADGTELFTVTDPAHEVSCATSVAVGDIDLDGWAEILAAGPDTATIVAFEHDGTFKWESPPIFPLLSGGIALADLDADGSPEIIAGKHVLNSDGSIRWVIPGGPGNEVFGPQSIIADLDLDGVPEVIYGNTAYTAAGNLLWTASVPFVALKAVANLDNDPYPEIVVAAGPVFVLEHDGTIKWTTTLSSTSGAAGAPTVADFDNDGLPEIGVLGKKLYAVIEHDGTIKWEQPIQEGSSGLTGSTVFDFEGDGIPEVVHSDEVVLRVYRGIDGEVLFETPLSSSTWQEYPVVVDVDADGSAEIIAVANFKGKQQGVYVFGDANGSWVGTRQLWNQHTYHITNINDDGTIPALEQNSWQLQNSYRQNQTAVGPTFNAVLEWSWESSNVLPNHLNVLNTPGIIDLNDDGIPDLVFGATDSLGGTATEPGVLRALSGKDGSELFTVTNPAYQVSSVTSVAVGDIDLDGRPEILAARSDTRAVFCFEHDGVLKWQSPDGEPLTWGGLALADLDADGVPEIIGGRQVWNASDGSLRWIGAGSGGSGQVGPQTAVADLDLDGIPEVIAGNTVYTAAGSILWWNTTVGDGFTAIANFDNDPNPEIAFVSAGVVQLVDHDGTPIWSVTPPNMVRGGPPTVADFDGDGLPEIGIAGKGKYTVLNHDGSILWYQEIQDFSSSITGSSVFDFEGDGSAEVVYRDELFLRVYRGIDGAILFETPMSSCTAQEYVQVVDIDADGNAEIVAVANTNCGYGPQQGVFVFGDPTDSWVATRQLWNQHTYHITNIEDDGTIPSIEQNNWETFNNYRQNGLLEGSAFVAPDLTASFVQATSQTPTSIVLSARIGNGGAVVAAASLRVAFYDGDPVAGGTLLGVVATSQNLMPGEFEDVSLLAPIPAGGLQSVFVVADDDGMGGGSQTECDEGNNICSLELGQTNQPPTCDAGQPYSVECTGATTAIQLDGSGARDPESDILTFHWSTNAPAAVFDDAARRDPVLVVAPTQVPTQFTVSLTVSDGVSPAVTCSTTVDLQDTTLPVVAVTSATSVLWPPNHKLVSVGVAVSSFDCNPDSQLGSITGVEVWSDEDELAQGSGNKAPDAFNIDDCLALRRERQGSGDGRVYLICAQTTDPAGNVGNGYWTVVVPHNQNDPSSVNLVLAQAQAALTFMNANPGSSPADMGFYEQGLASPKGPKQSAPTGECNNTAPKITSLPSLGAPATVTYQYDVDATDPQGDPITYSLLTGPVGMSIDSATGLVTWIPGAVLEGTVHVVAVQASDDKGGAAQQTFSIVVPRTTNAPPLITSSPILAGVEGEPYAYPVAADDADGDPLTFTLLGAPTEMAIDSVTGLIAWTPNGLQAGAHNVVVRVHDDHGAFDLQAFTVAVVEAINNAPLITSSPILTARVGVSYAYDVQATDADNDPLIYSFGPAPAGMTINSASGLMSWLPGAGQVGQASVTATVSDGRGGVSSQSFTILVDPDPNLAPVADAGPDSSAPVGSLVQLDGTASADPNGDPITYSWSFLSVPAGSGSVLFGALGDSPTFGVDLPGTYVVQLIVSDGQVSSPPDTVSTTVFTNAQPIAVAGADQGVEVGALVQLDGTMSTDPDGDPLTYQWSIISSPAGSTASLSNGTVSKPTFSADVAGFYLVELIVNDGLFSSAPDVASTAATVNSLPVANAGSNQSVVVGSIVLLDGSGSSDPDGDPLAYVWSLLSVPSGSLAMVSDPVAVTPTFTADLVGDYVAQLVVDDGKGSSAPATTTVTAFAVVPPIANAGLDQVVNAGDLVVLDGSGSSDPNSNPITYSWSLTNKPGGSTALLSTPSSVAPSFIADVSGVYVAELIVNSGFASSTPDMVTVSASLNGIPIADAGPDQAVMVGDMVQLNGGGSSDPDGDPLSYSWFILSIPVGSTPVLSNTSAVNPTFVADGFGGYVIQLVVSDGQASSVADTVSVFASLNNAPIAFAGQDRLVAVGDTVQLDGTLSFDPDGDPLTYMWSVIAAPSGSAAAVTSPTSATPMLMADVVGTYSVQLVVNDGVQSSAPDVVTILAVLNTDPIADAGQDDLVSIGSVVQLDGSASSDPDGDPLSFSWSLVTTPSGSAAMLSDLTALSPKFVADLEGVYTASLTVSDGIATSVADTVDVTVLTNLPPVADAGLDQGAVVGDTILLDGSGSSDPDGDPLSYVWSLIQQPIGGNAAIVNPTDPIATFDLDVAGTYVAQLTVSDGQVTSLPDTATVTGNISVPDVVGLTQSAANAVVLGTGLALGPVDTAAHATIPRGSITAQLPAFGTPVGLQTPIALTVSIGPSVDIVPPVVQVSAAPTFVNVGENVTLTLAASDNIGVVSTTLDVNGIGVPLLGGQASFVPAAPGLFTALGQATDAVGLVGTDTALFQARTAVDDGPPTVELTAPADESIISSKTDLIGTATDSDLVHYELQAAPVATGDYSTFHRGFAPVSNGTLGTLQSGALSPGLYDVRVCATDSWGSQSCSVPMRYEISGRPMPGLLKLAFLDGFADLTGLPIVIRRIYDSGNRVPGDFGVGWTLETQAIKLEVTRKMGDEWRVQLVPGFFPTYLLLPTKDHRVTVFLPDSTVHRFRMRPVPDMQVVYPIQYLDGAAFEPLPGTTSSLLPSHDPFRISPTTALVSIRDFNDETYNPPAYTLTLLDGRQLSFTKTSDLSYRLSSIRDTNGNVLSIGPTGAVHSSGVAIGFQRDAAGRITALTNPDGQTRTYTYDARGDLVIATDYLGEATRFVYDDDHALLQVIDPRGFTPGSLLYNDAGQIVAMIDPQGNRVDISYDLAANQQVVTNRLGHTTVRTYDSAGNLISSVNPLGYETTFTYDGDGNLLTRTNTLGAIESFTYDTGGRLLTHTDFAGNVSTRSYDSAGRLTGYSNALGQTTTLSLDATGNVSQVALPGGGVFSIARDPSGVVNQVLDPVGGVVSYTRDAVGHLTSFTDPVGKTTTVTYRADGQLESSRFTMGGTTFSYDYSYDANGVMTDLRMPDGSTAHLATDVAGFPVRATNTLGNNQSAAYDAEGALLSYADLGGQVTTVSRDAEGRPISIDLPGEGGVDRTLDPLGNPTAVTLPSGSKIVSSFDPAGRVITQQRSGEGTFQYTYDALGNTISVRAPDGGLTAHTYDAIGRRLSSSDPLGATTSFQYDADGNPTRSTLPDGAILLSEYDLFGRLTAIQDPSGSRVEYTFDTAGQTTSTLDPAGGLTTYTYDELGRLTSATTPTGNGWAFASNSTGSRILRTFPWGGTETRQHDAIGQIVRFTDATGAVADVSYNEQGSILSRVLSNGFSEARSYDSTGRLADITADGLATTFAYEPSSRLRRVDYPDGTFLEYTYTSNGNVASIRTAGGTTSYEHDTSGRLAAVDDTQLGRTTYSYDLAGRVSQIAGADGSSTAVSRDGIGQVTRLQTSLGATTLRDSTYTYDVSGKLMQIGELGRQVTYSYDSAGRISTESRVGPDAGLDSFAFDADWSLTQIRGRPLAYDGTMRLTNDGVFDQHQYDDAGRPLRRSNASRTEIFAYDAFGRLTTLQRTGAAPSLVELEYDYTGLVRRVVVNGVGRNFLWDSNRSIPTLCEERGDNGVLIRRYVHGLGPIGVFDGAGHFLHSDPTHSIRHVTALSGDLESEYAYTAYGEQTVGGPDSTTMLRFGGELFIPELGLYYLRSRFYDPVSGRFLTPDIVEPSEGVPLTFNPYQYANGNPTGFRDPLGTYSLGSLSVAVNIVGVLANTFFEVPNPLSFVISALSGPLPFDLEPVGLEVGITATGGTPGSFAVGSVGTTLSVKSTHSETVAAVSLGTAVGLRSPPIRGGFNVSVSAGISLGYQSGPPKYPPSFSSVSVSVSGIHAAHIADRYSSVIGTPFVGHTNWKLSGLQVNKRHSGAVSIPLLPRPEQGTQQTRLTVSVGTRLNGRRELLSQNVLRPLGFEIPQLSTEPQTFTAGISLHSSFPICYARSSSAGIEWGCLGR
jgi:RHS repeat-associated protein